MIIFSFVIDFLAASIGMMVTLCVGVTPHAYAAYYPNPFNTIPAFCKIRAYMAQCFTMMYRWLMAMACIDRYMLSSSNVRLRGFANSRIAYRIILIFVISWLVLPVHNLIFIELKSGSCSFPLDIVSIYHSIFTIILGGLLPPIIMIICAILIGYNLASKQKRRQSNIHQQNKEQGARLLNVRDQQALGMLFVQVGFYFLSVAPWTILLLINVFTRDVTNKSTDRLAIEAFLKYITEIFIYIYPTISFYIYTLTSHTFRNELINTIQYILSCGNRCYICPQRIGPTANTP
jgi:hypothetical protein